MHTLTCPAGFGGLSRSGDEGAISSSQDKGRSAGDESAINCTHDTGNTAGKLFPIVSTALLTACVRPSAGTAHLARLTDACAEPEPWTRNHCASYKRLPIPAARNYLVVGSTQADQCVLTHGVHSAWQLIQAPEVQDSTLDHFWPPERALVFPRRVHVISITALLASVPLCCRWLLLL